MKQRLLGISWVTGLREPVPCEGIKWGAVSGNRPPGHPATTCRNMAHYHFTALKNSGTRSGNYCWSHLVCHGLYGSMAETARLKKWIRKNNA